MDNLSSEKNGFLFESIEFKSINDVRNLIDNLTIEQSLIFLNKSIEYSYLKGTFSLTEAEIISKSLHIINSKLFQKSENNSKENEK